MKYEPYKQYLMQMQAKGQFRTLPNAIDMTDWLDFSTNNYLNLSHNPEIISSAIKAAEKYGVGATGARLLSGNHLLFEALEKSIAKDKSTEDALVFNSGFQANSAVLASILSQKVVNAKPVVFFDKLNHASLYQGVLLSGAELVRYRHRDLQHLEDHLKKYSMTLRPKWIITESLFGMDGDIAPLNEIVELAKQYGAGVFVDEAHAIGLLGENGYGLSTTVDLTGVPHIIMGTLSKAIGACGGYVACDHVIKQYLINHAPGFIYTTALSPMVIGAAVKAWEIIKTLHSERKHLFSLAAILKQKLLQNGFKTGNSTTHIMPILVGKENDALALHQSLLQKNIRTSCVRPPTVPPGSSRLRIALTVKHQESDLDRLVEGLCTL